MQKLNVLKYWPSETHRFFSTNSRCMMAIWPAGPPKLMKPSFTQNRKASQNPTGLVFHPRRLLTLQIISTHLVN